MKIKINETFIFKDKISFLSFGKKISQIDISEDKKIKDLKIKILEKYKLSDSYTLFKVIYKNKELEDDYLVKEIKENDTVYLVCKDTKKLQEVLRSKGLI